MPQSYTLSLVDYNGETSRMGINIGVVTAATIASRLSQAADLRAAVSALILGNQKSDTMTAFKTNISNNLPTDPNAQVERKWLVTYADDTQFFDVLESIPNEGFGKTFQVEIATANAELLTDNAEFLDLSLEVATDFITAFENMARSPYGGQPVVLSIELVGRTR